MPLLILLSFGLQQLLFISIVIFHPVVGYVRPTSRLATSSFDGPQDTTRTFEELSKVVVIVSVAKFDVLC